MGTTVSEIYRGVVEDMKDLERNDVALIAMDHYNMDTVNLTKEQLIDRIASIEVENYLK